MAGRVKTRLTPPLTPDAAAGLHRRLLAETAAMACSSGLAAVELWCAPDTRHPLFRELAAAWPLELFPQAGADLGARMAAAAESALREADAVVLIGTDCPLLGPEELRTALVWLEGGCDAVLGPAEDGGYVLIGLRRFDGRLFDDIPWGGARVLDETRGRLNALGWRFRELAPLWDLDRPADLERYRALEPD